MSSTNPDPNHYLDEHANREARITQLITRADTMPGPIGALLRDIGNAWHSYLVADQDGTVTVAEYERLMPIVEAALACFDWLTAPPEVDA